MNCLHAVNAADIVYTYLGAAVSRYSIDTVSPCGVFGLTNRVGKSFLRSLILFLRQIDCVKLERNLTESMILGGQALGRMIDIPPIISHRHSDWFSHETNAALAANRQFLMYYSKHEHKCSIRYKTRSAAESFTFDKAQIASVLNSFENDPFYTHLFTKGIVDIDVACISREHRGKSFVKIYVCFIKYKDSFTAMISLVFCSRIINEFLKHAVLMFTAL